MRAFRTGGRLSAPAQPAPSRRIAGPLAVLAVAVVSAACGSTSASAPKKTTPAATATPASADLLGAAYDTSTPAPVTLDGAGANSIEPFFETVFYQYNQKNPNTTVNYSPAGSSVGVTDIQQGTVAFGDSEIPMTASQLAAATGGTVLQIPVDLGGVDISYNAPGVPANLKLDGPTLAGIFDGSITNWDAPQIAQVSGVSNLPNLPIKVVHRADASGPGYDLDQYLIDTSPAWVTAIGTSTPSRTWPLASVGIGEQLNTGVATYISQTSGSIGFVEYGYALQNGFVNAAILNEAGSYVAPSEKSIVAAGAQATSLSPTNFNVVNEPGSGTYPIANFSWTLVYQKQSDSSTGIALGKLFDWVVTTGQEDAASLGYAPLPSNVVTLAENTILELESSAGTSLFFH
ncbi:MAG: phosphate ABC transporter substrate-binding protein PstS [Candidatus Dormibacteria bacterium]